jgi:hypothetical protein
VDAAARRRGPARAGRTVALGAALLAVGAILVAVLVAPAIDAAKDERAASAHRAQEQRRAARRQRQRRQQQPGRGRVASSRSGAAALAAVEAAIGRDARRRFDPRARPATCEVTAGVDAAARRVAYDCLSAVRAIVGAGEQQGARGRLGIPYRAVLDFGGARYVFCKLNPVPGEKIVPDSRSLVELPRACRVPPAT